MKVTGFFLLVVFVVFLQTVLADPKADPVASPKSWLGYRGYGGWGGYRGYSGWGYRPYGYSGGYGRGWGGGYGRGYGYGRGWGWGR